MILERLFSKKDKEEDIVIGTKRGRNSAIKSLLTGSGIALGSLGALKLSSSSVKKMNKEKISKDDGALYNKLYKTSKDKGQNVYRIPENSPFGSCNLSPGRVNGNVRKEIEALDKTFNPKKSTILVNNYHPSSIAHEMGHAHFHDNKKANKLIKAVHNPYLYTASVRSGIPAAIVGFKSGKNSVKHEKEGTKESKLSRLSGMGTGLVGSIPMLVAEGGASYKGLQYLKQHGADLKQMKRAKKNLALSGGTYLALAGINTGLGELGRGLGKAYAFRKRRKEK